MLNVLVFNGKEISVSEYIFLTVMEFIRDKYDLVTMQHEDGLFYYYFWSISFDFVYCGYSYKNILEV